MSYVSNLKLVLFMITIASADMSYLGCFYDLCSTDCSIQIRVLDYTMIKSDDMTIGKCINYCLDFNSPTTSIQYAGLETSRECYCGEEETDYDYLGQQNDESCNPPDRPCLGDSTQACGGDFAIAIYDLFQLTCPVPSLENGVLIDSSGSTPTMVSVRMNVTFYCHVGYYLDGNNLLQCIVTTSNVSTWNNHIPVCRAVCSPSCMNGGYCFAPNMCSCPTGWQGPRCETPVCSSSCMNGGVCSAPDTCDCLTGCNETRFMDVT
ncbi:uncharacterized protein [Amphiura filiformis]|uniref:uncharacterized protein n=1 Tax=Amphiura filiformis TaxID=82378 RepID=UPI003B211E00